MTKPLYTISIAVHNNLALTERCLKSVADAGGDFELIIYDNASTDGTHDYLTAIASPDIGVMRHGTNTGFGAAHNATLGYAKGIYFVVLNNDVIVQPGWLEKMREKILQHSKMGIVGPGSSACQLDARGVGKQAKFPNCADYVEGSCLMIPTHLARREGLFDPLFHFAYCEDADLSLRLRKKGWDIGFTDQFFHHERGATSKLVKQAGTEDLEGHHRENHEKLRLRWRGYLKDRRFEEDITIRRKVARGDVLLVTPIIRELKKQNAHARIHVETLTPEVLVRNPYLDSISPPGKRGVTFNLDLGYESNPKAHVIDAYAQLCGIGIGVDRSIDICYGDVERRSVNELIAGRKVAAIHPGVTAWSGRNWSREKFDELSKILADREFVIAVVGDKKTPLLSVTHIDMTGVDVRHTAAFIHASKLFVGIDSFPMHIAQACMIPTVGIFGAIDPKLRLIGHSFIRGVTVDGLECLGCHHHHKPPVTQSQCHRDRVYCMEDLTVAAVLKEIDIAIKEHSMNLETSKIRDRVIQYCEGRGVDIGCGADKIKPDAIGVDKKMSPDVDVLADAAMRLPFDDGEFDYVYSSHALEDIADTEATLKEWTRILKKGGKIIIQVPHPEHYKGCNLDHVHPGWTPEALSELLFKAGCHSDVWFADVGENRYSSVVVAGKV